VVARGLRIDEQGTCRCAWAGADPLYVRYHDAEWGLPVADDQRLFEKLCLEGFQSGLSWLTILRKREAFRRAFAGFDPEAVARFDARRVRALLADAAIVRHRGKIESAIQNARRVLSVRERFGSLATYVWRFEPAPSARPRRVTYAYLMKSNKTLESIALSKALKQDGFTFVGPTTVYAFMQAMGLVDDHLEGCAVRAPVERARAAFVRPR
jgi:DNA-3-methyladenine glycosylase I